MKKLLILLIVLNSCCSEAAERAVPCISQGAACRVRDPDYYDDFRLMSNADPRRAPFINSFFDPITGNYRVPGFYGHCCQDGLGETDCVFETPNHASGICEHRPEIFVVEEAPEADLRDLEAAFEDLHLDQ